MVYTGKIEDGKMARVGEIYDSKYSLEEELTPGSVGQSYLCRSNIWPDKKLILKIIHPDFLHMPGFSQSFGLVAKSLANLKIPQLVPVLELGKFAGELYYVSPFIDGKSLRRWMKETLNFEERILTGLETLKKLSQLLIKMQESDCYAYLKPENIILHEGQIYLKEFWIAGYIPVTYFEKNAAAAHYLPYAAPELKEDWGSNTSSGHCYALGAMLYEILIGKAPLGKFKLPSSYSNIYNRDVDKIILNFLAQNPDQRISKLEDIQKAINHLLLTFIPTKNKRPDIEEEWHEQSMGEGAEVSHVESGSVSYNLSSQNTPSSPQKPAQKNLSAMDSLRAMEEDFENEDDDIDTQVIDHLAFKRQLKEKEEEKELEPYPGEEETKQMPPIMGDKKKEPAEPQKTIKVESIKEGQELKTPEQDRDVIDVIPEDNFGEEVENDVFANPLEDSVVETQVQNRPAPDILKSAPTGLKKPLVEQPLNTEVEEEEDPPVPLAVKIILAVFGVALVGGAVFLGFSQALLWK